MGVDRNPATPLPVRAAVRVRGCDPDADGSPLRGGRRLTLPALPKVVSAARVSGAARSAVETADWLATEA
jgi:hypothetical protein